MIRRAVYRNGRSGHSRRVTVPPYRVLSRVYDDAWSAFCSNYIDVLGVGSEPGAFRPTRVLDLGCGTGELLALIATAVPDAILVGVDASPDMCERAGRRVPSADIRSADMVSFAHPARFDLVTCTHDAINYPVDDGATARVVSTAARHLVPGGTFAFDFATPEYFAAIDGVEQWTATQAGDVRQVTAWNAVTEIATTRFVFPGGAVEHHRQRAVSDEEMARLLEAAGFEQVEEFEVTAEDVPTGTLVWCAVRPLDA